MNTSYYYQDLLPWPVHGLATTRFNPTRVSALLVYNQDSAGEEPACTPYMGVGGFWIHRLNLVIFLVYPFGVVWFYAFFSFCGFHGPLPCFGFGATLFMWCVLLFSSA